MWKDYHILEYILTLRDILGYEISKDSKILCCLDWEQRKLRSDLYLFKKAITKSWYDRNVPVLKNGWTH